MQLYTKRYWPLTAALLAAALFGCASVPKQAFDPTANANLKRIALLEIDEPKQYVVFDFGNPGMLFGAIGGALAGGDMELKGQHLTERLQAQNLKLGSRLTASIEQKLGALHYEVIRLTGVREKPNTLVSDYTKVRADADAILDVLIVMTGYISQGIISDYEPCLRVSVRLVSTQNQQVLYRELLAYGEPWRVTGPWVQLPYTKSVGFSNFDKLLDSPKEAGEGIGLGIEAIASKIAFDLKK